MGSTGRTTPTYRNLLERVIGGWESFRRPLRREDREAFDRMMDRARRHSSASGFNTAADPNETMFMSILLEHEKELRVERGGWGGKGKPMRDKDAVDDGKPTTDDCAVVDGKPRNEKPERNEEADPG